MIAVEINLRGHWFHVGTTHATLEDIAKLVPGRTLIVSRKAEQGITRVRVL